MNNDEDFEREQEEAGVISTQRLTYQEMTTTWRNYDHKTQLIMATHQGSIDKNWG